MAPTSKIVLKFAQAASSDRLEEQIAAIAEDADSPLPQDGQRNSSSTNNIIDSIETDLPSSLYQRRKKVPITRKPKRGQQASSNDSVTGTSEQIRQLKQVTSRLVARAEEVVRVYDGNVPGELEECLNQANDLMIDMISVIEQKGSRSQVATRWERQQERWSREFELQ